MRLADGTPEETALAVKCDLAGEVLRSFGSLRFAATGWSMLPSIWPGDTLLVERVSPGQIHVGEVVLVGREGRLCAHRVTSVAGDTESQHWITQGDALAAPDLPVTGNELLGRVSYLVRAGKCIAVRAELSGLERLVARILRQSMPATRFLACLHRVVYSPEKPAPEKSIPEESDLPCQS